MPRDAIDVVESEPKIVLTRALRSDRDIVSPASTPAVPVSLLVAVWLSIRVSRELTWSTRPLTESRTLEESCATVTVAVLPTVADGASVTSTPGTRLVNVLVLEVAVMPRPRSIEASVPARTEAPPSRSVPSALVRVNDEAAPVVVDSASSR